MMRRIVAALLLGVTACGSPEGGQDDGEATALRDAAQSPLEQAEQVQQTLDDHAARVEAGTNANMDGAASDAKAKKDEEAERP